MGEPTPTGNPHSAPPDEAVRRARLQSVDALRAVAALWVVLNHSALGTGHPSRVLRWLVPVGQLGYAGVGLFLVLSGFSIHLRWAQQRSADFSPLAFWRRRFIRLYPTYLAALGLIALALLAVFGSHAIAAEQNAFERLPLWHAPAWWAVIDSVTVVFANFWVVALLPQAWSLALEEQIYFIYSVIGRVRRSAPLGLLAGSAVLALVFRVVVSIVFPPATARYVMYFELPSRAFEWVLGLVVAEAFAGQVRLPRGSRSLVGGAIVVAGTGYLALHPALHLTVVHRFAVTTVLAEPFFGVGFAMILGGLLVREATFRGRALGAPVRLLARIGLFSYSIYLLHPAIMRVIAHYLPGTGPARRLVIWAAVIACSYVFYLVVERHFIARASSLGRSPDRQPPVAQPVGRRRFSRLGRSPSVQGEIS